jgi:ADP-ribose pyrophosphatase YjhB (NUDIX family)
MRTPVVQLLLVAGCPHADAARHLLAECLDEAGLDVAVVERVGEFASPTIAVDGVDVVTGTAVTAGVSACRLDLPTRPQVLDALRQAVGGPQPSDSSTADGYPPQLAVGVTSDRIRRVSWPLGEEAPARHRPETSFTSVAADGVEWTVDSGGQRWRVGWYPPPQPSPGTMHGAVAICVTDGKAVLVSSDGVRWGLPGGRPEPGEDWTDTLRREILEEACATVGKHRLLGYSRGTCIDGHEQGLVLVRAHYLAEVTLQPWQPAHEMTDRRLVPADTAYAQMWIDDGFAPMYRRMFAEAAHGM